MIHKYFDKTYLINLDKRTDRLELAQEECKKHDIEFERFPAVDGSQIEMNIQNPSPFWNKGALGILYTTLQIIEKAKEEKLNSVLILEDDVEFEENTNKIVSENMDNIPSGWDTIFFGANHQKPTTPISNRIHKLGSAYALHCYAIHHSVFDELINLLQNPSMPLDQYIAKYIHSKGNSYCFRPPVAYQKPGFSDIVNKNVDYNHILKK